MKLTSLKHSGLTKNIIMLTVSSPSPFIRLLENMKFGSSWFVIQIQVYKNFFTSVSIMVNLFNFLQFYWVLHFTLGTSGKLHKSWILQLSLHWGQYAKFYRNCSVQFSLFLLALYTLFSFLISLAPNIFKYRNINDKKIHNYIITNKWI